MPDFSGASLKLKAEGEDKLLATLDKIDRKARETVGGWGRLTQAEVDKASAAFDQLYGKQSKAARQTQQVVEDVAKKVETSLSHSAAVGLGELARGFGRVAESGNLSAFAVREFTGAAFRLGGALGTAGLGTGIGLAVIAVGGLIEYFQKAGQKADEMGNKYQQTLERIAHASTLFQISQDEQFAYSGDPLSRLVPKGAKESDIDFLKRTGGQLALAQEAQRVKALIAKSTDPNTSAGEAAEIRAINLHGELTKRVQELDKAVGEEGMAMAVADQRRRQLNVSEEAAAKARLEKKNLQLDSRSVGEYENEELNRIVQRIKASGDLIPMLTNERNEVVALRNEQALLRYELDRVNMSVKDRIEKEKELARVTKELQQTEGTNIFMNGMNVKVNPKAADKSESTDYDKQQVAAIKRAGEKMKEEANRIASDIGRTLARGITDGIKTWFSGGGFAGGFKALTASILDGLGQMFAEVAEKALIGSTIMKKVIEAIQGMNPWVAAVAAGALLAFGNSLRSSGGSGSGGGGGYGNGSSSLPNITNTGGVVTAASPNSVVTNPASIQSRSMQSNTYYVIGEDPKAWRQVQKRLDENGRRG